MKNILIPIAFLAGIFTFAQAEKDTIKSKEKAIEGVTVTVRKPTIESKVDRTVFNVSNSSILAGNTTWDVLRMTPLVSIDNNDAIKAEGETVTVYINDRKSVFTGKELKEYLKTIPADNLMKIEVITSPSSRYEATGSVINIVLKKRDDEGIKGSVTLNNRQNTKNSQYTNLNLNYHRKSDGLCASIDASKIQIPTVMLELEKRGGVAREEMFGTFNMGVGMIVVVDAQHAEKVLHLLDDAYEIGEITEGSEKINLKI